MNLSGGRTKDGGDIVGASVFYHDLPTSTTDAGETKSITSNDKSKSAGNKPTSSHRADHSPEQAEDPVATLDEELTEGKRLVEAAER